MIQSNKLSIVMLEDDQSFCSIVRDLLLLENNFEIMADYQLIAKFKHDLKAKKWSNVSVFWVDLHLPDGNGYEIIADIKSAYPLSKCLVCTYHSEDLAIFSAIKNGADGYILKDNSIDQINQSLHDVVTEGAAISPFIAKKIIQSFRPDTHQVANNKITQREQEVLTLLANGLLYKEISSQLNISLETTKKHVSNIYQKLHVQNRTEALLKFMK